MRQANITSSIDASPTYSGSRQRQFAQGLSRPSMPGSAHSMAFGRSLANANQTAATQRMAENNLKTSLAGQAARSQDLGALAGLYGSDYQNQIRRRTYGRQLAQSQLENDYARQLSNISLASPIVKAVSVLSGLFG